MSDDQESSIDQNNDNISLSSIDEDNSVIYEDIDVYFSKDVPLEHYEENDYDVNENDEHSSTHQSLDEDYDQQD